MSSQVSEACTVTPVRPRDILRLNAVMSALGLARPGKKVNRVDALTYILDEIEKNPPEEVSRYLNPPLAGARRR